MPGQDFDQRQSGHRILGFEFAEYRRLLELHADVKTDAHENDADQERNAPGPRKKIRFGHLGKCGKCSDCGQIPDRPTDLNHRSENPAASGRRILNDHQHRPAPFTADPDALKQPQEDE